MSGMRDARHLCVAGLLTVAALAVATPSPAGNDLTLWTWQTEDLSLVYYDPAHAYVTPHLSRCFENSMRFHRKLFDYRPSEPVTVLLQDFDDFGFAGASALPFNYLTIGIEPFEYVYETSPTNERLNWVMSHELLHIVASDQASPRDHFFRKLFGGKVVATDEQPISLLYSYLTTPRRYAPRWYHEGMAVFMETWMAGGIGRALGGYDEMVFRTMVHDDAHFYQLVGLESEGTTTDFQIGQNAYLYGTRFVSYCAYRWGPEKVIEWLKRGDNSAGYYARQFKWVFGQTLNSAWNDWIAAEHDWQRANLDAIAEYPKTKYRALSKRPLGSVSRAYFDAPRRTLYGAALYPGEFAYIAGVDVDTWDVDKVTEIKAPALYYVASVAYDEEDGRLFHTTDNARHYRDLNVVNVTTGEKRMLLENFRTGDLAFNPADKSVWGMQHHNGLSTIVRVPEPYGYWNEILTLPYGTDIYDLDISPDGRYLTASMSEINGKQQLIRLPVDKLLLGDSTFEVLFVFANNAPLNFVHSADGRYLFGTSYYSGVSNIYRFDLDDDKMEIITNTDTGFFRPVPVSDDSLIVFRYTSDGFVPVMIGIEPIDVLVSPHRPEAGAAEVKQEVTIRPIRYLGQGIVERHPIVRDWMLGPPTEVDIDSMTIRQGEYSAWRHIKLNSVYPIVESYKSRVSWGLRGDFMEPLGLHTLDVTASWSPTDLPTEEQFHASATYKRWPWEVSTWYNRADFYDFFGPTKQSRKGYAGSIQYKGNLIDDRPKSLDYTLRLGGYGGLEKLPYAQNIDATFNEYVTTFASLNYKNFGKTIGGIESERGVGLNVTGVGNFVAGDFIPLIWTDIALGFRTPWDHSSIWVRPSVGNSFGDIDNSFANFYFGAFGNNWVDHGGVQRYREFYSFPGIDINAAGGTNFARMLVEWTLPPVRFESLGIPALYANWAHLKFFGSGLTTNFDNRNIRSDLYNVGAQLDIKLVNFTALPYTFSIGYAQAFEEKQQATDEFMISLKIF